MPDRDLSAIESPGQDRLVRPRFFGRRRGKTLRQGLIDLVDDKLPDLAFSLPTQGEGLLDLVSLFPRPVRQIWLEIGFGGGEHLAAQAKANPDIGFIGCEVFRNGIASLVRHVTDEHLDNVRIWPEDARVLFPFIGDGALSRIFVLFPDPWPKKRHAERRFIGSANLPQLARILQTGGELRVASDDMNYIDWSLSHLLDHSAFIPRQASVEDRFIRPSDWCATRYEQKALDQGKSCCYLRFERR